MAFTDELTAVIECELGGNLPTARRLCESICAHFGGQQIYVPLRRRVTEAEIREHFDGTNHAAVCRLLGISRGRLYQVIK